MTGNNTADLVGDLVFWEGPCRPPNAAAFFTQTNVQHQCEWRVRWVLRHQCEHRRTSHNVPSSPLRADKGLLSSTAAQVVVSTTPTASPGLPMPLATATVLDGFGNVLTHQTFVARAELARPPGIPDTDPVPGRLVGQLVSVSSNGTLVALRSQL